MIEPGLTSCLRSQATLFASCTNHRRRHCVSRAVASGSRTHCASNSSHSCFARSHPGELMPQPRYLALLRRQYLSSVLAARRPSVHPRHRTTPPQGSAPPISTGVRDYTIGANDYAYTRPSASRTRGWLTLRLVNTGNEQHMLGVVPVPVGLYRRHFYRFGHTPSHTCEREELARCGCRESARHWYSHRVFPPGEYVVSCFVKSPDGTYHVVKGMAGSFDVVAYSDTGVTPHADAVL